MIKLTLRMTLTTSVKMTVLLILAGEERDLLDLDQVPLEGEQWKGGDIKGEIPILGVHQFA
jgi:hypothetical protein